MLDRKDATIAICIGNYAAYNEGYLIDRWVNLPIAQTELDAILAEMQEEAQELTGGYAEEFYVSDYDGIPMHLSYGDLFHENTPIYGLNRLARVMYYFPEQTELLDQIFSESDGSLDEPDTLIGLENWILKADEIPFFPYHELCSDSMSKEEKLGFTCAEGSLWYDALCNADLQDYFDLERYGKDVGNDAVLLTDGYVDLVLDWPAQDFFSREEIDEMCDEQQNFYEKHNSAS